MKKLFNWAEEGFRDIFTVQLISYCTQIKITMKMNFILLPLALLKLYYFVKVPDFFFLS